MQLICISKGAFVGGEALAERLAANLGYICLSREELVEAATDAGIPIGKIEMAITRRRALSERLALERDHYLAFVTAQMCDRVLSGGLVYHGRTGHQVLAPLGNVLRVRVVTSEERRIQAAMQRLGVDRAKARRYLDEVDDDWRRWVHSMYGVSWEDAVGYDVTVNLEQLSIENAAASLTATAQLPDFQLTPASQKALLDLKLSAHCRLALAADERTRAAAFKVRADGGAVTISYLPQYASFSTAAQDVVSAVQGVSRVSATMATTNILWIQERFEPAGETFTEVAEIATKWNAAIELLRLGGDTATAATAPAGGDAKPQPAAAAHDAKSNYNGGIEDDSEEPKDDSGLTDARDELAAIGLSGGCRTVAGDAHDLVASLDRSIPYSLVVVGDVFGQREPATRVRMRRELQALLGENVKAPVVAAEDLKHTYLFGRRDIFRAIGLLAAVLLLFSLVFSRQEQVLSFLLGDWWPDTEMDHVVVAAVVFLVVPIVAFAYGTFAKILLKLIKIE